MSANLSNNPTFDVPISGTIAALNGAVAFDMLMAGMQAVTLSGTWAGTIAFQNTSDGSTFFPALVIAQSTGAIVSGGSVTANGTYIVFSGGYPTSRAYATAWTSGTATVSNDGESSPDYVVAISQSAASFKASAWLSDGSGNALSSSSGSLNSNVTATVAATDLVSSGTLTSGASLVTMTLNGQASLNVEISGTWAGTITVVEPGVVATGHQLYVAATSSGQLSPSITANGNYRVAGLPAAGTVQVAFSTYTSGTATVNMRASSAPFFTQPYQLNAANLLSSSWLSDGSGSAITSDNNGTSGNQRLHMAVPDTSTASTALGALNAAVVISMSGLQSAGLQLSAGTLVGTLVMECSLDGGSTFPGVGSFYDSSNSTTSTSVVFSSANGAKTLSLLPIGGTSHIRVRVSAYTSGTANALLRASQVTGAAGAITAAAFGTVNNTYVGLTANTTTLLLAANTNRKYAYISNNSGGLIAIQFGSATGLTSAARGLVIPNGNYYELKGDNLYTGAVYAYTNSSGLTVAVTEGTP